MELARLGGEDDVREGSKGARGLGACVPHRWGVGDVREVHPARREGPPDVPEELDGRQVRRHPPAVEGVADDEVLARVRESGEDGPAVADP